MDPAVAVRECERAMKNHAMKGALLRPNPIGGRTLHHPSWDPLYAFMSEASIPLVLHEGTTQDVPQVGLDRFDNFMFRHMVSHPFEQQMALMSLIFGGVFDRHPKLRVLQVEAGVGWVPYWLDRMEHHVDQWGHNSLQLSRRPMEYFKDHVFVSADPDEAMIPFTVAALGDGNVCFSTDYPHMDHAFEGVVQELAGRDDLTDENKVNILGANAARLFDI
jgi:predicted TIM-barrel fold metal-dependent hydrolase